MQFVIVKAFYPLHLMVSHKVGVHHSNFLLQPLLERLYLFTLYALQRHRALRNHDGCLGVSMYCYNSYNSCPRKPLFHRVDNEQYLAFTDFGRFYMRHFFNAYGTTFVMVIL